MQKNKAQGYLALAIAFALVSVIVFVVPTEKTSIFWIAYTFTIISFAAQPIIWKAAWGRSETLKSKFLGLPIIRVGFIYLVIQTIAFAVFVGTASLAPAWLTVVICCLILGVSAVCLIATDAGRDEVERVDQRIHQKVSKLKMLQIDVELLAKAETDPETKTSLTKLAERIRYSDPLSDDSLDELEGTISSKIHELKTSTARGDLISEIGILLSERNAKCKALK